MAMEKVKMITSTDRVRMYNFFDGFIVTAEQYFPAALDATPDGWRDTIWTVLQTRERADEVFDEFVSTQIRYAKALNKPIICKEE